MCAMGLPMSPGDSKLSKPSLPTLLAVEMFKPTSNEGVPGWLSQYSMLLLILGHEFEPYTECRHCLQKKKKTKKHNHPGSKPTENGTRLVSEMAL